MKAGYSEYSLEDVTQVSDPPADFYAWIFGELLKPPFICRKWGGDGKLIMGRCTACGGVDVVKRGRIAPHRQKFSCPFCKTEVEAFYDYRFALDRVDRNVKTAMLERLDTAGNTFLWRYFQATETVNLSTGDLVREDVTEVGRDIVSFEGSNLGTSYERFELIAGAWQRSPDNGERERWSGFQAVSGLERYAYDAFTYPESVEEALNSGKWRHFPLGDLVRHSPDLLYEMMLETYMLAPVVGELIRKGLYTVASGLSLKELLEVDIKRKSVPLYKALGLEKKSDLNAARQCEHVGMFREFRKFLENGQTLTPGDISLCECLFGDSFWPMESEQLDRLYRLGADLHRLFCYMKKETGIRKDTADLLSGEKKVYRDFLEAWCRYRRLQDAGDPYPKGLLNITKTERTEKILST